MLREAETAKTRIMDVKGKYWTSFNSSLIDNDYIVVGSHVDENLRMKVIQGKYVDFAKLIPRDRIVAEDDNCMEMINKGGRSFWVPIADHEIVKLVILDAGSKHSESILIFTQMHTLTKQEN